VDEAEAKLVLLQAELAGLQDGIRSFDTILFQVKGWCVTTSLAAAGFAAAGQHKSLLLVSAIAILGFWLVDCQFKTTQRLYLNKNIALDDELNRLGVVAVLEGRGSVSIGATGVRGHVPGFAAERIKGHLRDIWFEGCRPMTFGLYLFLLICLAIEAVLT
jgi:hypothetical protein